MQQSLRVVQCWDDGVTTDAPLIEILQRYGAKATFNLNLGLHQKYRDRGWRYHNTQVQRFGLSELRDVYADFVIANHSLSHPNLDYLQAAERVREIHEGRKRLQQLFAQPIAGFAYPFGAHSLAVEQQVQAAGHLYARTTQNTPHPYPPDNPMAFHPTCHFLDPNFDHLYREAKHTGVFYFWGHSYELLSPSMWQDFERKIRMISLDPCACWTNPTDLFTPPTA